MPPGPARQWQAMLSSLPRRLALQRTSFNAPRRLNSTAAAPLQPVVPHNSQGGLRYRQTVVVTSQVDSIKPSHLLRKIDRAPRLGGKQQPFAVFFLTPTFATWLLDDETFLHPALRKLFSVELGDLQYERSFHALCAVVDRLPTPTYPGRSYREGREATSRPPSPPFSELGFEGMSIALLDAGQLLPPHLEALCEPMGQGSSRSPGTINIHVDSSLAAASDTPIPHSTLQLPLANTVFHTGHSSTMFHTLWKKDRGSSDPRLVWKQQLQHMSFAWPTWHSNGPQRVSLTVPLTPITVPRQIEAGMGNIIRRIEGDYNQSVTASQELEETVPRYFAAKNIPAHAMKVWALVIPKYIFVPVTAKLASLLLGSNPALENVLDLKAAFQKLWQKDRPVWNDAVSFAMSRGARLHRVLSGGGGWGKKAGLLSLDPELSYDESTSTSQNSDMNMLELFDVEKSALKEIAKPGEFIQFFVSGPEDIATPKREVAEHLEYFETSPIYLELGTIPSTIDQIPKAEQESHTAAEPVGKSIHVFRGHFGALSEGGMSITREAKPLKDETPVKVRSKVDVPFSRFTAFQLDMKDDGSTEKPMNRKARRKAVRTAKKAEKRAAEKAAQREFKLSQTSETPETKIPEMTAESASSALLTRPGLTKAGSAEQIVNSTPEGSPVPANQDVIRESEVYPTSSTPSIKGQKTPSDSAGIRHLADVLAAQSLSSGYGGWDTMQPEPPSADDRDWGFKIPAHATKYDHSVTQTKTSEAKPTIRYLSQDNVHVPHRHPVWKQSETFPLIRLFDHVTENAVHVEEEANKSEPVGSFGVRIRRYTTAEKPPNPAQADDVSTKGEDDPTKLLSSSQEKEKNMPALPASEAELNTKKRPRRKLKVETPKKLPIRTVKVSRPSPVVKASETNPLIRFHNYGAENTIRLEEEPNRGRPVGSSDVRIRSNDDTDEPRGKNSRAKVDAQLRIIRHNVKTEPKLVNSAYKSLSREKTKPKIRSVRVGFKPRLRIVRHLGKSQRGSVGAGIKPPLRIIRYERDFLPRLRILRWRTIVKRKRAQPGIRPQTPEQRRADRRSASYGMKSRLHQLAWSLVPEHQRGEVIGAVWNRVVKKAYERARNVIADQGEVRKKEVSVRTVNIDKKESIVRKVSTDKKGRNIRKVNINLPKDKSVRIAKTPLSLAVEERTRERRIRIRRRARYFESQYSGSESKPRLRTSSRDGAPSRRLGFRKGAPSRGRIRVRKIVPYLGRNRMRKVGAIGSAPQQTKRKTSDPEVAQLIDEVESWLVWDAKPPAL